MSRGASETALETSRRVYNIYTHTRITISVIIVIIITIIINVVVVVVLIYTTDFCERNHETGYELMGVGQSENRSAKSRTGQWRRRRQRQNVIHYYYYLYYYHDHRRSSPSSLYYIFIHERARRYNN